MSEENNKEDINVNDIQNPQLQKLAQSVQESETEQIIQGEQEQGQQEGQEGQGQEQPKPKTDFYQNLGKFTNSLLITIAQRRGLTKYEIDQYITLSEPEMDMVNDGFGPILRHVFEDLLHMTSDEVGALMSFLTVIGPRIPYLMATKPKENNKDKEKQQLSTEANKQNV